MRKFETWIFELLVLKCHQLQLTEKIELNWALAASPDHLLELADMLRFDGHINKV